MFACSCSHVLTHCTYIGIRNIIHSNTYVGIGIGIGIGHILPIFKFG